MKLNDVYQAPAEAVEPGTGNAVERFTPASLLLVAALFLGQLLTGLTMRVGSLHPTGLLPRAAYGAALFAHGGLQFASTNAAQLALALMLRGTSSPSWVFRRVAVAALCMVAIRPSWSRLR